jgi:hypothetical protein
MTSRRSRVSLLRLTSTKVGIASWSTNRVVQAPAIPSLLAVCDTHVAPDELPAPALQASGERGFGAVASHAQETRRPCLSHCCLRVKAGALMAPYEQPIATAEDDQRMRRGLTVDTGRRVRGRAARVCRMPRAPRSLASGSDSREQRGSPHDALLEVVCVDRLLARHEQRGDRKEQSRREVSLDELHVILLMLVRALRSFS